MEDRGRGAMLARMTTPLQDLLDAVKAGRRDEVLALVDREPALLETRTASGESAILVALYHTHTALAKELLTRHPRLNLFEAAALGQLGRIEELVRDDESSVNAVAPDGFSALHLASYFGHPHVADWLLQHGADVDAVACNGSKLMPLHSALAQKDEVLALAVARALLSKKAVVTSQQTGGFTPLHAAAARGSMALVELLLAHGADPSVRNDAGRTPADLADEKGHRAIAEKLRGGGP